MSTVGRELGLPSVRAAEQPVAPEVADWAVKVVESTGLAPLIERWTKQTTGRPRTEITVEGFLVSMVIAMAEGRPALLNVVEAIAYRRLPVEYRQRFRTDKPTGTRRQRQAAYKNVRDCFHRIVGSMDPSPLPKNRRLLWFELDEYRPRTPEEAAEHARAQRKAHARLRLVTGRLLQASYEMMPRDVRRRWKGSVTVDGTKVPVFAVGQDYMGTWESTDPDAGWHTRTDRHEHHGLDDDEAPDTASSTWGYEAHLAVMAFDSPIPVGGIKPHPTLCLGVEFGRPSTAPGRRAMGALSGLRGLLAAADPDRPADERTGLLGVDRAYTGTSKPEDFHVPASRLGYRLVFDYKDNELGRRGDAHGAVMVEGGWYCPAMPEALVTATVDHRAGRIDEATWRARLALREKYAFKAYEQKDGVTRMTCPAAGLAPTASCPLKPRSQERFGLAAVMPSETLLANPARACRQKTITVADDRAAKYRQHVPFQSDEWRAAYGTLRNCVEGYNGTAKDALHSALEAKSRRRVRGVAAQWLLCSFLVFGENCRRVQEWMDQAADDAGEHPGVAKGCRAKRMNDSREWWDREKERRKAIGLPVESPTAAKRRSRQRKRRERKAASRPGRSGA